MDVEGTVNVAGDNVLVDTTLTYKSYEIIFSINDGENPLEEATINFDGKNGISDSRDERYRSAPYWDLPP